MKSTYHEQLMTFEKNYLLRMFKKHKYNMESVSRASGLCRSQLMYMYKRHNITLPEIGTEERPRASTGKRRSN